MNANKKNVFIESQFLKYVYKFAASEYASA